MINIECDLYENTPVRWCGFYDKPIYGLESDDPLCTKCLRPKDNE